MSGVELASAYVSLIPSFKGGASAIVEELGGPAKKAGEDAGKKSGEGFGKSFGSALKIGVVAAVALIGTAVSEAMDIEAGTDKLAASLGLTAKESERIGGVAGHLYANAYGGSLEEVNTAVGAVVSSISGMRNASGKDVEALTAHVLDMASAFEIDTTRAAQVAGQLITTGLAKDGTQAVDLLTAALQRVPVAVRDDIVDAADEYSPFFQAIGIDGPKAFSLLVAGAQKGMYGIDKTGDAIKELTVRATDGSKATVSAFESIGLNATKMRTDLLAGGKQGAAAFDELIKALQNSGSEATESSAALALFGTPLEDLGATEIPKFVDSLTGAAGGLGKVDGAADRMGKTLNDNAKTNLTSFGRSVQQAFVNFIGGNLLPAVTAVAKVLANVFGPAVRALGEVMAHTLIPALKAAGGFFKEHQAIFGPLAAAFGAMAAALLIYKGAIGVVSIATKAWTALQTALNVVLNANPIGLIILAIVGLVAAVIYLWNNVEGFRTFVLVAWEAIKTAFTATINAIVTAFQAFINAMVVAFQAFVQFFVDGWNIASSVFHTVIDFIVSVAKTAWNAVTSAFGTAVQWVKDRWNGLLDIFRSVGTFFANVGTGIADGIKNGVKSAVNFVIGMVNGLINGINFLIRGINAVNPFSDIPSIPHVPKLAKGGTLTSGGQVMVGERGKEIVSLPEGASVTNNRDTEKFLQGNGNGIVHIDTLNVSFPNTLNALSPAELRKAAELIKEELRKLERSRA